jgi:hypothetical protein
MSCLDLAGLGCPWQERLLKRRDGFGSPLPLSFSWHQLSSWADFECPRQIKLSRHFDLERRIKPSRLLKYFFARSTPNG